VGRSVLPREFEPWGLDGTQPGRFAVGAQEQPPIDQEKQGQATVHLLVRARIGLLRDPNPKTADLPKRQ